MAEPRTGKSMGDHCEDMAKEWNISRDSQDEWAVSSHKLAAAYERGFFNDLIAPFRGVERDNILRPDTSLEKLATLKPAFDKVSGRHAHRRQLHPADRRCRCGTAGQRRVGTRARP